MNNVRLTIVMLILAAAIGPAILIGWSQAREATEVQQSAAIAAPVASVGFKEAPWVGAAQVRRAEQPANEPASTPEQRRAMVNTPVVVELFTSEGCSSCPPAEKLINELAAANPSDSTVYFLVYHVDYWDRLGWKDRFSRAEFSERQRAYASALESDRVYTPQTVVNGRLGFVGSDRKRTEGSIQTAKTRKPSMYVGGIAPMWKPGETIRIRAKATAAPDLALPEGLRLCVALVEDGLKTEVKDGENKGRTLEHARVVRAFGSAVAGKDGDAEVELTAPSDVVPERCSMVVFAQDGKTMVILGAAGAEVHEAAKSDATGVPEQTSTPSR